MAGLAGLREPGVARVLRCLIVREMARGACSRQPCEFPADVATGAGGCRMFSSQRELGGAVIEHGAFPLRRRMTRFAGLREAGIFVVWVRGRVELRLVTVHARGRRAGELSVLVTGCAFHAGVFSGQGEAGQTVIELRSRPLCRRVTGLTLRGEIRCTMIGILRRVEVGHVATGTRTRRRCEFPIHVTRCASGVRVRTHQCESSKRVVIEPCSSPLSRRVAGFARDGELRLRVVRIGCSRKVGLMAPHAFGRQRLELSRTVARGAGSRRVLACQWKSCGRVVETRSRPLIDVVAGLAGLGESCRLMVHGFRLLELWQMTT